MKYSYDELEESKSIGKLQRVVDIMREIKAGTYEL